MPCPIKPLNSYIVVQLIAPDTRTSSGLYLPDAAKDIMQKGLALAVSEKSLDENNKEVKPTVKVGDTVLFHKSNATSFKVGDEMYYLVREPTLYGVLNVSA